MIKVSTDEYNALVKYIYDVSGITLEANKVYLVETRLGPLVAESGCTTFSEFYYKAKSDPSKEWQRKIINAITTQETLFFRDKAPFEVLQYKILPDLIDIKMANHSGVGRMPIRIWSAACSTGQEAYSTAMTLLDVIPDMNKFDIKIVGTDISDDAVKAASYGHYNKFEIDRGLPADKLQKYFEQHGDLWKIKDEVRIMTSFRKFNLFGDLSVLGKFDIVFCRNVAIYFSIEDRKKLFDKIANAMSPHGSLLIGSSEYLAGICDRFESTRHLKTVFYKVKDAVGRNSTAMATKHNGLSTPTGTTPNPHTSRLGKSTTVPQTPASRLGTLRSSLAK